MQLIIRASHLSNYHDCPRRGLARMIPGVIEAAGYELRHTRQGIGAAVGTAAHAAIAYRMYKWIEQGDPNAAFVADCAEAGIVALRKQLQDGVEYDSTTATANDGEHQLQAILRSFIAQVQPALQPDRIEERMHAQITETASLSGQPDCEGTDAAIDDWKTGAVVRPAHGQFGGYSLLRKSNGRSTTVCRLWHIPRASRKKIYPGASAYIYNREVCERAAYATIGHIMRDAQTFEDSGSPVGVPANTCSMLCSAKFCPAHGTEFCELTKGL